MQKYNPKKIEKKWQKKWEEEKLYKAKDFSKKPKKYILVEFPYPSGAGLHVGHVRSYAALDTVARKCRMQGENVLYPIGFDAFGLPTENYAIKNKIHPKKATEDNIATFKKQLKSLGLSFDWSRKVNTTDPEYYKWTQWIFLQLYKKGLAYKKKMPINWCPSCKIGLAHEEVVDGKCERCGANTEQKEKEQWMLAITKYAEKLIKDLDTVDYLDKIKTQQINWIGKSEGSLIKFQITKSKFQTNSKLQNPSFKQFLEVFTTRPDTLYGVTYMVLAPEHELIKKLESRIKNRKEVKEYIEKAKSKSNLERTDLQKEKTGVEIKGVKAINPVNNEEIPIYIADYVLSSYGTGAIMAVPAHDERDFEFAKKYNLPIKYVIAPFFTDKTGKDAVREDKKTVRRLTAYSFVKHWNEDKYLCLDWEKFKWHSCIVGEIKKNEDIVEVAKREITEETGYKNIKFIKKLPGEFHNYFYAEHKGINRYAIGHGIMFQLKDGEKIKTRKEDTKNHQAVWIDKSRVVEFINLENNIVIWNMLMDQDRPFVGEGKMINSGEFNEIDSEEARKKITKKVGGKITINYKLRDWVFSRQHYWGEPIPMIYCEKCKWIPIPEEQLPIKLPDVKNYEPTNTGESPLASMKTWVNVNCPKCGGRARRETDTMPNWAGSSWYFLRYIDPKNTKKLADSKKLKYWMPIDLYNGGMEHTTLHLLYSRFWNKFLYEIGVVPVSEPYAKRVSHGMVLANDNRKMSKSFGNVINPDEIVNDSENGGADTLRMYEMFMGPFGEAIPWSQDGVKGIKRFLDRIWIVVNEIIKNRDNLVDISNKSKLIHKTIKDVTDDVDNMKFNTAVSKLMIQFGGINGKPDWRGKLDNNGDLEENKADFKALESFLKLLAPFAPHISEELWEKLGNKESIFKEKWPEYDEKFIKEDYFDLIIQISGKVRDKIKANVGISENEALELAKSSEKVKSYINDKEIIKVIMVKDRLLNIVVK